MDASRPLVEILVLTLLGIAALDGQRVLLRRDGDLPRRKAGQRQRNLIVVVTRSLDVVRRIVFLARKPKRIIY